MKSGVRRALWAERVQQWRDSGMSQRGFALKQGWPLRQTAYWIRVLRDDVAAAPPQLLPVVIERGAADAAPAVTLHGAGGWRVEIAAGQSAAWLAELLRRLA
ncbi:hypothetical protein ACFOLJ_27910 [Rugamonas sp. CCM 8940]|uniref:IS66 family insertion sequence element accessory protein TnpA n=1 Tax=Rugamonas sp. CCM 8940 TaxID=2765359 RepID=UPI0036233DCF